MLPQGDTVRSAFQPAGASQWAISDEIRVEMPHLMSQVNIDKRNRWLDSCRHYAKEGNLMLMSIVLSIVFACFILFVTGLCLGRWLRSPSGSTAKTNRANAAGQCPLSGNCTWRGLHDTAGAGR